MMKPYLLFLTVLCLLSVFQDALARDPFWPIGYYGGIQDVEEVEVEQVVQPVEKPEKKGRELTDEQLRELARRESERIRQTLVRKGTMIAGNKIYAYVQNKWLTVGDVLTVEVEGNSYRLEILNLTSDNIELEAHRAAAPLYIQPRKQP